MAASHQYTCSTANFTMECPIKFCAYNTRDRQALTRHLRLHINHKEESDTCEFRMTFTAEDLDKHMCLELITGHWGSYIMELCPGHDYRGDATQVKLIKLQPGLTGRFELQLFGKRRKTSLYGKTSTARVFTDMRVSMCDWLNHERHDTILTKLSIHPEL